jgi:hypothetical protein
MVLDGVFVGAGLGDGALLARCRLVLPVDAGSCAETTNVAGVRPFWSRLSTVDPGVVPLAGEAGAGVRRLDHRPRAGLAKATIRGSGDG